MTQHPPNNGPHYQPPQNPYPQAPAPPPQKPGYSTAKTWGIATLALVLGFMVGNASGGSSASSDTSAASAPAVQPAQPEQAPAVETEEAAAGPAIEAGTIPKGEWLVPDEVAPGRYRSTGAVEGLVELCSASTHNAGGDVLEWKTANAGEQAIITVSSGAATVSNSGCQTFTKID